MATLVVAAVVAASACAACADGGDGGGGGCAVDENAGCVHADCVHVHEKRISRRSPSNRCHMSKLSTERHCHRHRNHSHRSICTSRCNSTGGRADVAIQDLWLDGVQANHRVALQWESQRPTKPDPWHQIAQHSTDPPLPMENASAGDADGSCAACPIEPRGSLQPRGWRMTARASLLCAALGHRHTNPPGGAHCFGPSKFTVHKSGSTSEFVNCESVRKPLRRCTSKQQAAPFCVIVCLTTQRSGKSRPPVNTPESSCAPVAGQLRVISANTVM